MRSRSTLLVLLFALLALRSDAATTVATVLFDIDADARTGCTVEGLGGFEQALITTVETTPAPAVTHVQRRQCSGNAFGEPVTTGGPWAATTDPNVTHVETRIALADLGRTQTAPMRLVFLFTSEGRTVTLATLTDGSPIYHPARRQNRRRSVRPADGTQSIVIDGRIDDWERVGTLLDRGTHGVWAASGQHDLYFRFDLREASQAPVAANDSYDVRQGKPLVVAAPGVLANDSDPDENDLTAALVHPSSHGSVTLAPDGSFVYLNDGTVAEDGFDYKASDGAADSNLARVTINVTPNATPVANADAYSTSRGGTLAVPAPGVLANDRDADGDPLTPSVATPPARGALTIAPDGSLTYTHDGSTEPSDTFTYTVSDGLASSAPAAVTINVSASNAPPVAVDDVFHVANGGTLDVTAPGLFSNDLDSDTSQGQWTTTVVAGAAHGTLTVGTGGAFTYVHDGSGSSDSFTYRVNDGSALSNVATVTISVSLSNTPPVANADHYTTPEDTPLTIAAPGVLTNDSDAEGATLSLVNGAGVSHGTLVANADGSFTYTPAANYSGSDSFTYRASDGDLQSAPVTVTISVNAVNDAPVVSNETYTVAEGETLTIAAPGVLANDTDLDSASLNASVDATTIFGALALTPNGAFTYTHNGGEPADDAFTYTVTDGTATVTGTATIEVTEVNDAPFADDDAKTTAEDTPLTFAISELLANDSVGSGETTQTLAFTGTSNAVNGSVSVADGNITFTPVANFHGTASFRYSVIDNGTTDGAADAESATATVTIVVSAVNDAPVANADAYSVSEGGTLNPAAAAGVLANDTDSDSTPTAVLVSSPARASSFTLNADGSFTYTHDGSETTSDSFTYKANDGALDSSTVTVSITVNAVNDAPVAVADSGYAVNEGATITGGATVVGNDTDAEGSTLTALLVSGPSNASAFTLNADGTFNYTHNGSETNSDSFSYKANDGELDSNTVTVTIAVNAVNDAPVAVANSGYSASEGGTITGGATVLGNDTDAEADSLTAVVVSGPANASSFTLNADGTFNYTHDGSETTSDSFTYKANDGALDSNTVTVSITLTAVNDAPVATDDSGYGVSEGGTIANAATVLDNDTDAENNSLTAVLVSGPSNASSFTLNADGTFSYTHDGSETSVDSFTYKASDSSLDSSTVAVTITISAVNDAPVATADSGYTVGEGATLTGAATVVGNDTDAENDALAAVLVSGPANDSAFTLNADGTFDYTHDGSESTTDSFTYKAYDGTLDSNTVTVSIAITATNDAPVATADAYSVNEGATLNPAAAAGVLANDTDSDSTPTAVLVSSPARASSFTLNADGSFTYTHDGSETTSDSFTYEAHDGALDSSTVTVSIAVNAVNDAPVAVADTGYSVNEGATITGGATVIGNDTDAEGSTLTAVVVSGPANASSFTLNADGTFDYTHNGSETNSDSFTYKANDGELDSNTVTVSIAVNAVNDAPAAVADSGYSVNEGGTITGGATVLANDTDAEADSLTAVVVSGPANASSFTLNADGTFNYTHDGSETTSDSFTYKANDGALDSNTVTVSITITAVNDAPVATDDSGYGVSEGGAIANAATVLGNDTDAENNSLTAVLVSGPSNASSFTLNADGTFSYTHDGSETSVDSFTYKASDSSLDSNTVAVTITITALNDAPVATADSGYTAGEGATLTGAATVLGNDTDAENDALAAVLVSGPANDSTFTLNADGTFDYTHDGSETTTDSFTYKANDGALDSNTVTVSIAITATNDAPVATADAYSVNEGATLNPAAAAGVLANDTDSDSTPTAVLVSSPARASSFTLNADGSFTYTHDGSETTSDSFTYKAHDGALDSSTVTVSITVNAVNDVPVAVADTGYSVNEGATITGGATVAANDTDAEGSTLTALLVSGPSNASAFTLNADGTFDYTHDGSETTSDAFTYKANDGELDSNTVTVTIAVNAVNDAPVAVANSGYSVNEGGTITGGATVLGNDTDAEADSLTAVVVSGPANASSFTLNADGTFNYTHDGSETTSDSFTYKANDGALDSNTVTVSITVTAINDAPVAVADSGYSLNEGGTITGATTTLGNDTDAEGDSLTAVLVSGPSNSSSFALNSDGTFDYTHDGSETTTDSFTYKANDGSLDSNTVTVAITITGVNDAPVAVADSGHAVDEGGTLTGAATVLGNDTDAENDSLNPLLVSGPTNESSFTLKADGTFDYTHDGSETTSDSFTYKVNDGSLDSNTVTVSIAVNAINDAPSATDDSYNVNEGATLTRTAATGVLANDSDPDSVETAQLVGNPSNASSFTLNADGSFTYTHDGSETTSDSFTYKATDGSLESSTVTVTITVTAVNDAPVAVGDSGYSTTEGGTITGAASVLANDTDAENDSLTAILVSGPANESSFTFNSDGTFDYTHDGSETTTDSFTYKAKDAARDSNTVTVAIAVTAVNDAPVAVADTGYSVAEGGTLTGAATVLANDTDAEGTTLSALLVSGPARASAFTFNPDGTFNYTHNGSETIADSFTYKANDSAADSNTVTVSIVITQVNDAPVANSDSNAVAEDAATLTVTGNVLSNDTEVDAGDSLVVSTVAGVAANVGNAVAGTYGSVTIAANGAYTYTLNNAAAVVQALEAGENVTDVFAYVARDTANATSGSSLTLTITGVNDAPVAVSDTYAYPTSGALTIGAPGVLTNDTDAEGTSLTAILVAPPAAQDGTLAFNSDGSFTFTKNAPSAASTTFTYRASDGLASSTPITVTITFNTPPVGVADTYQVLEDSGTTSTPAATGLIANDTDSDGDTLTVVSITYNATTYNPGDTITTARGTLAVAANGSFSYTPNANEFGAETFSYALSDGTVTATGNATITIVPVNDQPSFTKGLNVTINEDSGVYNQPWATAISQGPSNESTQTLTFTAAPSDPALVSGGTMNCISVPDAGDPSQWAIECTVTVTGITVNATTGNLSFTPQTNRNGSFTLGVKLQDTGLTVDGGKDTYPTPPAVETVTVTINPVNDAPTFSLSPTSITQREDQNTAASPLTLAAFARSFAPGGGTDEASQSLVEYTVRAADPTFFQTLSIHPTTGDLVMVPAANRYGNTNIYVKAKDSGGIANGGVDTFERTVPVSYLSINDAPILTLGSNVWAAGVASQQTLANWASAVVGPPNEVTPPAGFTADTIQQYTVSVPSVAHQALFSVQPAIATNGTLTFTPAAGANGNATVNVQVRDSGLATFVGGCCQNVNTSATQTFTISIGTVNSPPSFTLGASPSVAEESPAQTVTNFVTAVSPGANAADVGQTVTFGISNNNNALFNVQPQLVLNGANYNLTYTPKPNTIGTATVTVTATDSGSNTAPNVNALSKTFTITITNVNDMPSFVVPASAPNSFDSAGVQTVTNFATSINRGAPHESSDALTFVVTNNNSTLFSAQPAISSTGTLTYTGAPGAFGSATVTVSLKDDGGTWADAADDLQSAPQTFSITIDKYTGNVNDAPTFTVANQSVAEDPVGAQTVNPFITSIGQGGDDTGQTVTFTLSGNTNTALFSTQPTLTGTTLTYTPAANANGVATLTVTGKDNGGTGGGGVDTTVKTFTITVTPVNDAPNFTGQNLYVPSSTSTPTAHSIANWATGVSTGPSNESTQTPLTRSVTVTAGASLFTAGGQPALSATNTLTFTTAVGQTGTATIDVTFTDNGGLPGTPSVTKTYTIGVGVNSPPSFAGGGTVTRNEDTGAHSIPWATVISAGYAYETGQTITFEILSNNNTALFAAGPVVQSNGSLEFTTAADRFGTASVQVRIKDDGGTPADPSDDLTGNTVTFAINLTNVNDPPTFTIAGHPPTVETGASNTSFSVTNFATSISAGPFSEPGTVSFIVTANSNTALFSTQPAINVSGANGTLTYTVAANQTGSANITVKANDGSLDSASTSSFTITVVAAGALTPVVPNRTYTTLPNTKLTVANFADGLLSGITDPTPSGTPLVVKSVTNVDTGATFAYDPDIATGTVNGTFSYTPKISFAGSDSMTYQVCDGTAATAKCASATLTLTMTGPVIYYVDDDAAVGGDGSLLKPWKRIDAANSQRLEGSTIFVLSGTYAAEGGLTLRKNERVVGQGVAGASFDAFFGITPPAAGSMSARPQLNGAGITTPNVQLDAGRTAFWIERLYSVVQSPTTETIRNFNISGGNALNWQVALSTNVVTLEDIQVTGGGITGGKYGTGTFKNIAMTNGRVQFSYMEGLSASFQNVDINNNNGTMAFEANWSRSGSVTFDAASSITATNTPQQGLMIMDSRPDVSITFNGPVTLSGGRDVLYLTGDTINGTGGANITFGGTVNSTVADVPDPNRWSIYSALVSLTMSGSGNVFSGGRGVHLDKITSIGTGINIGSIFAHSSIFTDTSGQPIRVTGGTINSNNGSPSQSCFVIVNAPNVTVSGVTANNCTLP